MTFTLYDDAAAETALWSETHSAVTVTDGLYNVILGSMEPITPYALDGDCYLGITVGSDEEMTPRMKLTSVAYAVVAGVAESVADGAVSSSALSDTSVTETKIAGGAVSSEKLADASVTSAKIVDGTLNASDMQDGTALAELADNDGAGSGLDADLLDGLHASAFMSAGADNWVNESGDTMFGPLNLPLNGLVAGGDQLVLSNGRVGIGTSSPADLLDVNGDIRVRGADIKDAGGTSRIALTDNGRLDLREDGGTNALSVATNGYVGIGTTAPSQRLDVAGSVTVSGDYRYSSPKTGILKIPAAAFAKAYSNLDVTYDVTIDGWGYIGSGSVEVVYLTCPVYLPFGATVTGFRVFYGDTSTTQDTYIQARLRKRVRYSLSPIEMSLIEVSGSHYSSGTVLEQADATISYPAVAVSDDLWIWVRFEVSATGSYLRFYGCQVEYEVSTVH